MAAVGRAVVSVLCAVACVACSATLRDGTYTCADGHCPSTMLCWSDGFCPFGTEVMHDAGMPGDDAWMPPMDGAPPMSDMGGPSRCATMCVGADQCVIGAWTMPTPSYACGSAAQIMTSNHGMTCTPGPFCMSPDVCIPGSGSSRCLRPCGAPSVDVCGFGEDCIAHGGMGGICARPCSGTCPSGGAVCSGGYCLPPMF